MTNAQIAHHMGLDKVAAPGYAYKDMLTRSGMTVGAMISTLCEKGLGGRARDTSRQGKPIVFGFTALGVKVAMAVGLK